MSRVLLVGAGHAHLHAVARTAEYRARGLELVLVSPGPFWYSGMGPGLLGGIYTAAHDSIDVADLVERGGGRAIRGHATTIDPGARSVTLGSGERVAYDVLSLNVGSTIATAKIAGAATHGLPVKPVHHFLELRRRLLDHDRPTPHRLVVIGGGAAGCETVANAVSLARGQSTGALEITLVSAASRLLPEHSPRAHRILQGWMRERRVRLRFERRVTELHGSAVVLDDGSTVDCDTAVVATGVVPPPLIRESGLACDPSGAMLVDRYLQSITSRGVFGGGDCVQRADGRHLDRVGVYAVRASPVLHHNLLAAAEGAPLEPFRPQRRYLLILNLGDGTGLLLWGPVVFRGRLAFRFKDWLDRRFLARFRLGH